MGTRIRLAVVGGGRGASFSQALEGLKEEAELAAVCDRNEAVLNNWKEKYPGVLAFSSYESLLDHPNVDAVFLATPMLYHARQAIQALKAGKHVISEVIASHTLEDSWELVETVEQTGLTYMMSENYCYMRPNLMVKQMVQQGLFGEVTYAECGYIHDVRSLLHDEEGGLTWRGEKFRDFNGNLYPTHSLGPVAQWLGMNGEDGDEFDTLTTFSSKSRASAKYFREHFGGEHPGSQESFWKLGDSTVTLIRTKKGVLIALKYDVQSSRPHNMTHYTLQGTTGAYLSPRRDGEDPLIWLDGRSKNEVHNQETAWESLWLHADEWEHPLWKQWSVEADAAGHGGGDFFVLKEFVSAISENRRPAIDVYDAVSWSSVFPLSVQSVASNGSPVQFVNFRRRGG